MQHSWAWLMANLLGSFEKGYCDHGSEVCEKLPGELRTIPGVEKAFEAISLASTKL